MNSSSVYSSPSQGKYEYLITSFTSDSIGLLKEMWMIKDNTI